MKNIMVRLLRVLVIVVSVCLIVIGVAIGIKGSVAFNASLVTKYRVLFLGGGVEGGSLKVVKEPVLKHKEDI